MTVVSRILLTLTLGFALPTAALAQSGAPAGGSLLTYTNTQYGFSLSYPPGLDPQPFDGPWSGAAEVEYGSGSGTCVVRIVVYQVDHGGVATGQPYPLFFTAEARVGVSDDTAACYPEAWADQGGAAPNDVSINGVVFRHAALGDAGMMKYTNVETYRVIHRGLCYSVDQLERGSDYRDDSMTPGISDEELARFYEQAGAIVRSFRFKGP